jgi:hypothetical protein
LFNAVFVEGADINRKGNGMKTVRFRGLSQTVFYQRHRPLLSVPVLAVMHEMIDHRQSRAARSLLGWTQHQLADTAGVALATIPFFETNKREAISHNLTAIRRALEDAGVEFISGKSRQGCWRTIAGGVVPLPIRENK